jgi:hypothetical protein
VTIWSWLWIGWGVAFLVIEAAALINKDRGDTLSEHVWSWFQLRGRKDGKRPWQVLLRLGFVCFWVWLTFHFLSGGSFL